MYPARQHGKSPWQFFTSILRIKIWKLSILLATVIFLIYCSIFILTSYPSSSDPHHASLPGEFPHQRSPPRVPPLVQNPRFIGIDTQNISYYKAAFRTKIFRCISSQEEIPVDHVNDDYCDCPEDGSDEPATSACSYKVKHQYFFCTRSTERTRKKVPSAWVGDGICDCCDGSDEFTRSDVKCPDHCSVGVKKQQKPGRVQRATW